MLMHWRAAFYLFASLGLGLMGACSSLLPKAQTDSSAFATFDEARSKIESLVPEQSNIQTLMDMGIDPAKNSNITLLTHAAVVRRFVPASILSKDDLDPGVVACLEARDACRGLEIIASKIARNREGNFFLDFFAFKQRTETTGWRFNAVVLLLNDVVVYRSWGGQPVVNESDVRTSPLGPLQNMGPSAVSVQPPVVVK
jgi:hypothetical protein